ncbi:hypothetical protein EE612_009681 [Oryza sativa]|nr:hypothetical protein EE612_009681 [Oryza sativa]
MNISSAPATTHCFRVINLDDRTEMGMIILARCHVPASGSSRCKRSLNTDSTKSMARSDADPRT